VAIGLYTWSRTTFYIIYFFINSALQATLRDADDTGSIKGIINSLVAEPLLTVVYMNTQRSEHDRRAVRVCVHTRGRK
jgi:hypothetical protein